MNNAKILSPEDESCNKQMNQSLKMKMCMQLDDFYDVVFEV